MSRPAIRGASRRTLIGLTLALATAAQTRPVAAQGGGPLVSDRLVIRGTRLSIAPGDETQTLDVAESATVRTCFGGVCGAMAAGDARVAGLTVQAELSGPEIPDPIGYSTAPGGAFVLPGFQAEGTYLLSNVRLVRASTGEVLGNATPAVVVLEVRRILVTSATVRQLTLAELQARGISITQQSFQAFSFSVGFAFSDSPVTIEFPVLFQEGGQVGLLSKPEVKLDQLPPAVAAAVRRWQPPTIVPFKLEVEKRDGLYPTPEEALEPETRLFGVIVLPGNVSFLNQFFDAQLLVANGAPPGSGAVLTNVTAAIRLPAAVPRELLRLAETAPPVAVGQKVPVLGTTGSSQLGPGEQGTASFTLEGLVPGTHVVTLEIGADLARPGRDVVALAGKLKAAIEVVDARFNLAFNHPDVVREGEAYTLYVTVSNLSRATQNLVTVELLEAQITGAHKEVPADDFSITIPTLEPGEARTVEFRLVADVTGRCVATTFQTSGPAEGTIRLRTGVGEAGIPLSPSSLVLPRFTELLPAELVRPNVRLLGLAYSLAVAPPGAVPEGLPRVLKADVERRAVDLAEAGQRLFLADEKLASAEALLLDQLGNRHDLPEFDQLRRTVTKGRDAAEALATLLRQEQQARALSSRSLLEHLATTMSYGRPYLAAALETGGTGALPTLEIRKLNGTTGVTYLAYPAGDARALRSLAFGEAYDVLDGAAGASRVPLAVVGRLSPEAAYVVAVHGPAQGTPAPVTLSFVAPAPSGAGFVRVELSSLAVPPGQAWAVEVARAAGDARPLTFALVHLATGLPVAGAPSPVVRPVDLPPFRLVGARQDFVLDPYGSGVWYLFNRPPARGDAEDELRWAVETRFRGLDTTTSGEVQQRSTTFAAASAIWQPTSERVVAVRYQQPVSAIVASLDGQPVVTHEHRLDAPGLHDAYGNALSAAVPSLQVEAGHAGGLVEGKVLRGSGDPVQGATVQLVRTRVIPTDFEPIVLHDLVAERTTGADGAFFFPFIEEPILAVPRPREKGAVQSGFRLRALVPSGPDPLAPAEREEVESVIRLQSRLARVNVALLGRGSVRGRVLYDDGSAVAGAEVTGASTLFSEVRSAVAGAEGAFRIDALPVGPVTIAGRDRSGRSAYVTVGLSQPGAVVDTTLRIDRARPVRTGSVAGRVLLRRQTAAGPVSDAASGASVTVYSDGVARGHAEASANGAFRFDDVPSGRVTVQAADFSVSRTAALVDLDLAPEQTSEVTLTLTAGEARAVEGRVLFHDPLTGTDLPVPGATVFVVGPGSYAYSGPDGSYRIEGVPVQGAQEAPWELRAIDFGRQAQGATPLAVTDASPDPVVAATIVVRGASSGAIDGVVLDPLGRPAGGVTVTLVPVGETVTRGDGTFTFEGVGIGRHRPAAHRGDGLQGGSVGWIGEAEAEVLFGGHRAFTTIRLRGAGTLNVRTRTASAGVRSPVTYKPTWFSPSELAIRVKAQGIETTTDDDGRLTLTVPVGAFAVSATNPFHGGRSIAGTIDFAGQVKDVDLLFEAASTVKGRVVDVDGITPVPSIDVELSAPGLLPQRQRTDALGAFRFELVPPGVVSVVARGLRGAIERTGQTYGAITGPGQELDLVVRLEPQGTVRGRVVEETSPGVRTPLPRAQVALQESDFPYRRFPAPPSFLVAGADGRFELPGVSAGTFSVLGRDPGQLARQGSRAGELSADFEVVDVGDVVLSTQVGTLTVLVRDPVSGASVPDAQVFLGNGEATVAGPDGRVTFSALALGSYDVHAFDAPTGRGGRFDGARLSTAGETVDVVVPLDQRGRVSGVLFDDAARTRRVGGGVVRIDGSVNGRRWGAGIAALATTSREDSSAGSFAFDGLPVGSYRMEAAVEGSPRRAAESVSLTPTATEAQVALVLEPVRDVFLRLFEKRRSAGLVEVNPDPVVGDGVFAVTLTQGGLGEVNRLAPDVPYPGHTFAFRDVLAAKGFGVTVQEAGGEMRRAAVSSAALSAGASGAGTSADPYRIPLLARGTVRVTVRDAVGAAAAGATVRLHAANGSFASAADASGRAAFTAVEEGGLTVSASIPSSGLGASSAAALQFDDDVVDVELSLTPAVGAHGTVYEPPEGDLWTGDVSTLRPASGIAVRIRPSSGPEQLLVTGEDGVFRFQGLAPGPYSLEAQSLDGARRSTATGALGTSHGTDYALPPLVLDGSRPRIVSITPPSGQEAVSRTAPVEIVFSEPLAASVLPTGPGSPYFRLEWAGGAAAGSWSSSVDAEGRQVVRFTPSPRYENVTAYSLVVTGGPGGVRDREGRPLTDAGDVGSSFTTSDTDGPRVVGTVPSLERPVDPEAAIRLDFSEKLLLTAAQLQAAVLFEWQGTAGVFTSYPVTVSLTRGGYSILVDQPQGVTFAGDTLRRRLTVTGLTDSSGNPMPAYSQVYRLFDHDPPGLAVGLPENAPNGDLAASASYRLTPVLTNLADVTPENPGGDLDRVEYTFASAADPLQPAAAPGAVRTSHPYALDFVAAYAGDGTTPRPFPVWVKAFDTSGNSSAQVRLDMRVLPNSAPVVGGVSLAALSPVAGTFYAGSLISATVAGFSDADDAQLTLGAELRKGTAAGSDLVEAAPSRTVVRPAAGWPAAPPESFTFTVPLATPEGSGLFVRVRVVDAKGASGASEAPFSVADDAAPPVVSDLAARRPDGETATSFVIGESFFVELRASDGQTAVRAVSLATSGGVFAPSVPVSRVGTTTTYRSEAMVVPASVTAPATVTVTAAADDHGGNRATASLDLDVAPSRDPTLPTAEWLSPFEGGVWPAAYSSVDGSKPGVDLLLRIQVADRDRDGSGNEVPGSFVDVKVRGPVDAAGTLDPAWTSASRLWGTAGSWVYEAVWRVPNGIPAGTPLPFEAEVTDAGANRATKRVTLTAVAARHVYEAAATSVISTEEVPAPAGTGSLPVFLLDGATVSLYPRAAGGPRTFSGLHLYSGGAWSAAPGSAVTVRRTALTAPEVTSYGSLVPHYPLELSVGEALGVAHGAAIDVSGRGLLGGDASHDPVALPGERPSAPGAGGSHGGNGHPDAGDWLAESAAVGSAYGNVREPDLPGSGGGRDSRAAAGGGVLEVDAPNATLTLQGDLAADGARGQAGPGAAGGSIRVRARRVEGRGSIHADGSAAAEGLTRPGGGGGRVSLSYVEPAAPAVALRASGAVSAIPSDTFPPAGAGTVFLQRLDAAGVPADRGTLRVGNPASSFPAALTPLPGLGSSVVTAVDAAARRLVVRAPAAVGSIVGDSVVVTVTPAGAGSPSTLVTAVRGQVRTGGSHGSADQTFALTVDAPEAELGSIASALAAGAAIAARARLRFAAFEGAGASRVVLGDELEVAGALDQRATLSLDGAARVLLSGEAPAVSFEGSAPAAGTSVAAGATIEVRFRATDPLGLAEVEETWSIAGTTRTRTFPEPLEVLADPTPTLLTVPLSQPLGPVTYTVRATDRAGRITERTATWTVAGDVVPPVVTSIDLSPQRPGDAYESGETISIAATATDDVALALVRIEVDGRVAESTTSSAYLPWLAPPAAAGTPFTVAVRATDAAGNVTTRSRTVTVSRRADAVAPTLSVDCPTSGALLPSGYASLTLQATARDEQGIHRVEVYRGAEPDPLAVVVATSGWLTSLQASAPGIALPVVSEPTPVRFRLRTVDFGGNAVEAETEVTVVPAVPLSATGPNDWASLASQTAVLESGTLVLDEPRTLGGLIVLRGAAITHAAGGDHRVDLTVDGPVYLECGASIDATGRGWPVRQSHPGAGTAGPSEGGAHIGFGNAPTGTALQGTAFGSVARPAEAGGGGANAPGGGVVRLRASRLVVDRPSAVRANGGATASVGAGAGGSVWVTADAVSGDGPIEARGGYASGGTYGSQSGGGGAVRLELRQEPTRTPAASLSAAAGSQSAGTGTVVVTTPSRPLGELVFGIGQTASGAAELPSLGSGVAAAGTAGALLATGLASPVPAYFAGHWVEVATSSGAPKGTWRIAAVDGSALTLEPAAGETITLEAGDLWRGVHRFDLLSSPNGGNVASADPVRIGAAGEAAVVVAPNYRLELRGALEAARLRLEGQLAARSVAATSLTLEPGARLWAVRLPGADFGSLRVDVAQTLRLRTGAAVDAGGAGYVGGQTSPGATPPGPSSGGSHLGLGAVVSAPQATSFGSVERPREAGGGGASYAGGGVLRVVAGVLELESGSAIRAAGAGVSGSTGGAGAGGSIWITAGAVTGDGTIEAPGGSATSAYPYPGSGGGGAIVVEHGGTLPAAVSSKLSARGGRSSYTAGAGTVLLKGPASTFGELFVDNAGTSGPFTDLPSFGGGAAQDQSSGAALVTQRASIPSYFAGHWIEVSRGSTALGVWRVATIDGSRVTLEPNAQSGVPSIAPGDVYQGVYRFDSVTVQNGGRLQSGDPIRDRLPTIGVTAPAVNATFASGASVTVSFTASDDRGVAKVRLTLGSASVEVTGANPTSGTLKAPWLGATATVPLVATVFDVAGQSVSVVVPVTILAAPPLTASITYPATGAGLYGGEAASVSVTVPDGRPLRRVTLSLGAASTVFTTVAGPTVALSLPVPAVGADELRSLSATVEDDLGGTATSLPVTVRLFSDLLPRVSSSLNVVSPVTPGTSVRVSFASFLRNASGSRFRLDVTGSVVLSVEVNGPCYGCSERPVETPKSVADTWGASFPPFTVPAEARGPMTLVVTATDGSGRVGTAPPLVLDVQAPANQPPLVRFSHPNASTGAGVVGGETLPVWVYVEDDGALGRLDVTFGPSTQSVPNPARTTHRVDLAAPVVTEDQVIPMTATVVDDQGLTATDGPVPIRVLTSSVPRVTASVAPAGSPRPGDQVQVGFEALAVRGARSAALEISGAFSHAASLTLAGDDATFSGAFPPVTIPADALGRASVVVRVTDEAGQTGASAPIEWRFGGTDLAPTVALAGPSAAAPGDEIVLALTAADDAGLRQARLTVTGAIDYRRLVTLGPREAEVRDVSRTIRVPVPRAASGSAVATVEVTDSAGQAVSSDPVLIGVADTTPPVVSRLRSPQSAFRGGLYVQFQADVVDRAAVSEVRFVVDGQPFQVVTRPVYLSTYEAGWYVLPSTSNQRDLVLRVEAVDFSGNVTVSERTFPVLPDAAPIVRFYRLTPGAMALSGQVVPLRVELSEPETIAEVAYYREGETVPFATATSGGFETTFTVPADSAAGSVIGLRADARNLSGAVSRTTTSLRVVAADLLGDGTALEADDLSHEDRSVAVRGELIVRGRHRFANLVVLPGGAIRHDPSEAGAVRAIDLEVTGDAYVWLDGWIEAARRGFEGGLQGTNASAAGITLTGLASSADGAGGSHGGSGSPGSGATGGPAYGSVREPALPGSGGGADGDTRTGGSGGGVVRLSVGNRLVVDGNVDASGDDGQGGGGGAGGSIAIEATSIGGDGAVWALGGSPWARAGQGGGAGGGRVRLRGRLETVAPSALAASGSQWFADGAPGTVFVQSPEDRLGHLLVDGGWSEQMRPTELVSLGGGEVSSASGREIRGTLTRWVRGVEGLWLDVRRGADLVGRFQVASLDPAAQTLTLEEDADGQIEVGDSYSGAQAFDSTSVTGRSRLETADSLEGDVVVGPAASLASANLAVPPQDATPTISASVQTHAVHAGDPLPVTVRTRDDRGLSRLVLWIHGDDASVMEIQIAGAPTADERTVTYSLPSTLAAGERNLGIGVLDDAGQWTSTLSVLQVSPSTKPTTREAPR